MNAKHAMLSYGIRKFVTRDEAIREGAIEALNVVNSLTTK